MYIKDLTDSLSDARRPDQYFKKKSKSKHNSKHKKQKKRRRHHKKKRPCRLCLGREAEVDKLLVNKQLEVDGLADVDRMVINEHLQVNGISEVNGVHFVNGMSVQTGGSDKNGVAKSETYIGNVDLSSLESYKSNPAFFNFTGQDNNFIMVPNQVLWHVEVEIMSLLHENGKPVPGSGDQCTFSLLLESDDKGVITPYDEFARCRYYEETTDQRYVYSLNIDEANKMRIQTVKSQGKESFPHRAVVRVKILAYQCPTSK